MPTRLTAFAVLCLAILAGACAKESEPLPSLVDEEEPAGAAQPTEEPSGVVAGAGGESDGGGAEASGEPGTVSGVVRFEGVVPELTRINLGPTPECHSQGGTELWSEDYLVSDGKVENALVYIRRGLPRSMEFDPVTEPAVIDQKGCRFIPHILAVQEGQPIEVLNSDEGLHNVHIHAQRNPSPNFGLAADASRTLEFKRSEIVKVSCDVHPWMLGYVGVFKHPFFAVTGKDGAFRIEDLPPGEYRMVAWHERFGTFEKDFTLASGADVQLDFTMTMAGS